jgi:hypothetical protein
MAAYQVRIGAVHARRPARQERLNIGIAVALPGRLEAVVRMLDTTEHLAVLGSQPGTSFLKATRALTRRDVNTRPRPLGCYRSMDQ